MAKIKFGTDGWRAVIAEDFTFANVSRVAQATASYWNANPIAGTEQRAVEITDASGGITNIRGMEYDPRGQGNTAWITVLASGGGAKLMDV